jgi:hypothetical protein
MAGGPDPGELRTGSRRPLVASGARGGAVSLALIAQQAEHSLGQGEVAGSTSAESF